MVLEGVRGKAGRGQGTAWENIELGANTARRRVVGRCFVRIKSKKNKEEEEEKQRKKQKGY